MILRRGRPLEALKAVATTTPPNPDTADDTFSDARLAETIADDVLTDRFVWVSGIKAWMMWAAAAGPNAQT
jgi:hypothetical protein